jgi:hypothetical protein
MRSFDGLRGIGYGPNTISLSSLIVDFQEAFVG